MRRWIAVGLVAAGVAALVIYTKMGGGATPDPGISQALAQERAGRISDLRYHVAMNVPARANETITGKVTAQFMLKDASAPVVMDFVQAADHVKSLTVNGRTQPPLVQHGHIVIAKNALSSGATTIEVEFIAGSESLNRHDDFMYTLFVPARASLALPCFDQPDLKARWTLALDVPPGWSAVANGAETGRLVAADHVGLIFAETQPLPTYLFAFATGKFSIETAEREGRTFRMFHRETDAAKVARNRDAVFDLHAHAIKWLEDYTGIPYPFGKFDFVLIPSFQFGGMEHAGAIYYNASGLLLDESATQNQMLGRANVISHETSHMWFGDLVTMKWFNDVWMKEVFANFMAAKIVNPSFPQVNHALRFFLQNYPSVYDVDRTDGANPIRQPLANLNEAGSLYGAIIYQKAPIVMRQLEMLVGADAFRDGLRQYLSSHAMGNATWPDLIAVMQPLASRDLTAWSRAWVESPGRPTIRMVSAPGLEAFNEEDPRGRGLVWPQRIDVVLGGSGGPRTVGLTLPDQGSIATSAGQPAPAWVLPTGGGLGYGFFDLDAGTLEYLATSLGSIADPLTRGAGLVTLWESMLEGRVPPVRVLDQLLKALPREADELNVAQMLGYLRAAYWRFTAADDRAEVALRVESILRDGLARASTTSLKSAWFGALQSVATTPVTIAWLERVWKHEEKIAGLPLSESDEADLALDLALRDVADANQLLQAQLARFKNPDRRARFAFVMPAVSGDAAERGKFFESLKDVKNRAHEAWVLDAARYLHHPLRASASKKYVKPALELVLEIQRTGDIFFPKRWADATLSGYQAVQTAAEVRAFIDHLPADYPPRLKWVLLSAADQLFRAAKVLNQ